MAVRHEKVVLTLEDNFSTGMARAAAATALLDKELGSLSGSAIKSTNRELDKTSVSATKASKDIDGVGKSADRNGKQIDKLSGRLRLLAEAGVVLGPALIPIGAAAIPAIAGLSAGLASAAGAAGVAVLAFQGVGDGMKALNEYQLEPTTANLEKMQAAMEKLGPAGADFTRFLDSLGPEMSGLQNAARAGLFPGMEQGIRSMMTMLPQVQRIVTSLASEMGDLAADAGAGLSGAGFASFFDYLETDAGPTLEAFGHAIGNVAEGLANMVVAFAPLSRDFSGGMERMTASFADWAAGLSQTQGFQDFVDYVQQSGPQVIALLGALGNAFVGILQAAAPVGAVVVPALTALANILAAIGQSPVGPALYGAAAAILAVNRAVSLTEKGMKAFSTSALFANGSLTRMGAAAGAAVGILAVASAVRSINDAARDSLPGVEQLTRGLLQLGDAGVASALGDQFKDLGDDLDNIFNKSWDQSIGDALYTPFKSILGDTAAVTEATDEINALDAALANIANTRGPRAAAGALQALADSGALTDEQLTQLKGHLPQYDDALAGIENRADAAADANSRYAGATREVGSAAGMSASQIRGLMKAMEEQKATALGAFDAQTAYGQAFKELQKQANSGAKGINAFTKAGQANRTALSSQIGAYNGLGKAQTNSVKNYEAEVSAIRRAGRQMDLTGGQIQSLIRKVEKPKKLVIDDHQAREAAKFVRRELDQIDGMKPNPKVDANTKSAASKMKALENQGMGLARSVFTPTVTADTGQASSAIGGIASLLGSLHDKSVTVTTYHRDVGQGVSAATLTQGLGHADGGYIRGPGGPRDDVIPAWLSNGEFVMNAAATARHLPELTRMNARRFADGGPVGAQAGNGANNDGDHDGAAHGLHRFRVALERAKTALDKETDKRDALLSKRNDLRSGISGGLKSDLWAAPDNPWGAGPASPTSILRQDIRQARKFNQLIRQLRAKGVNGAALAEIISSGDVERAQMMASLSRRDLSAYERAYNVREQVVRSAARTGGNAVYGHAIAEANKELRGIRAEVKHLQHVVHKAAKDNAKDVAHGVNGAAANGHRRAQRHGG